MNIAHCVHGLNLGGAQQIIKSIVRGSDWRGFHHYVYSPQGGVFQKTIAEAGATVRIIHRRLPKFDPLWVAALAGAMRRDAINVVHTHLFGDSLHGLLAARAAGAVPVVMTLHIGAEGQTLPQRLGYRWLFGRSARNVACTASVARSWSRMTHAGIETIPNAIEVSTCELAARGSRTRIKQALGIDRNTMVVGGVGRFVEQKGFDYLISAFAQLVRSSHMPVRLVLVGDGPLRGALVRQAQLEGVGHLVLFPGFRPDVPTILRALDVVVLSSRFEGLPIALLEAMAAERCVIGTDTPGIADAVVHEREALLVPAADIGRLSEALTRVLSDPVLRRRLGEAARHRFLQEFTAERMVTRYEAVYREVHETPGARRRVLTSTLRHGSQRE